MKQKLHVHYDSEGDILEVIIGKPTPAIMKNLGDNIFQRVEEKTGKTKGFMIMSFKKREQKDIEISLSNELALTV
ncbi:MAG: hypothetical protein AABX70_05210 [Nanoarchaeota archaeon]